MDEAERMAKGGEARETKPQKAPFELEELRAYLSRNAAELRRRDWLQDIAASLEKLAAEAEANYSDLERLEQHLTVLEDRMAAIARTKQREEDLLRARRDLDATLRPYRSKMTGEQLAMLERQYLERALLDKAGLPRLSLFYLR
jgi:DNA repair exonuclease SbcCD ATPase subunit